jgi:hypothetical protein
MEKVGKLEGELFQVSKNYLWRFTNPHLFDTQENLPI